MAFAETIREVLLPFQSYLDTRALERFVLHWQMVERWGQRLNLTSIQDDDTAAWLHYRDSLEPLRMVDGGPCADIGSGAGFPGIPMAILRPDIKMTLVEPRRKRASFLRSAVAELDLKHVSVLEARASDLVPEQYSTVVTRATFSDPQDLKALRRCCLPGGVVVALRRQSSDAPGSRVYSYALQDQPRVLEVWRV